MNSAKLATLILFTPFDFAHCSIIDLLLIGFTRFDPRCSHSPDSFLTSLPSMTHPQGHQSKPVRRCCLNAIYGTKGSLWRRSWSLNQDNISPCIWIFMFQAATNAAIITIGPNSRQRKTPRNCCVSRGYYLVAGVGFEPTTFRLWVWWCNKYLPIISIG